MAKQPIYTSATAKQTSNTSNSATYECTVSTNTTSYYGLCSNSSCIAIKKYNSYYKYWGWPITWKASWGCTPSLILRNGTYFNGPYGNLQGMLGDTDHTPNKSNSYTWTETVPIDKGTKRQGTKTISVGLKSGSSDARFPDALCELTLSTTQTADPTVTKQTCTVDPSTQSTTRYIRLSVTFENPDTYYTAHLYDSSNNEITLNSSERTNTTLNKNIPVTEDMYQKTLSYTVKLLGKDGVQYGGDISLQAKDIEPGSVGVYAKYNSNILTNKELWLHNVNHKRINEVWVYIDGEWKKTIK